MRDLLNKMKKLNENKNAKVVTFDFDNTIIKSYEESNDGEETLYQFGGINPQIIARIKKFKQAGSTVLVVTSREQALEVPESSIQSMLNKFKIQVDGVFYTNGEKKARKLYELGSSLHYDDDPLERQAIEAYRKLHPSDIVVKNPDDLLKDTDQVSKGLILTNDNKIIIVQRSDSLEWDAAGGHIMEGEEANFAFYREVLEEMSLKIKKIQYLTTLDTIWKKKKKLVHYFVGRIPYSCDELDGVVQLQWELEDYFCGDLEEVEETMANEATKNLKNVMNLFLEENFMFENVKAYPYSAKGARKKRRLLFEMEPFQKKVYEKHPRMKEKILTTGPNKKPYADGIKNVTDTSRSKSAPPLGEKNQPENKKTFKINIKKTIGGNNGD
jgi:8-oxo-dGTP pyrophosphatase MutT (NUDIX family)|tara:strand:- start:1740 stop:2891 length:1152 start_codon:yes stop_codon:yes gene_type:complete